MKSPFTGGNAEKKFRFETYTFRNEEYTIKRFYYQCVDTGRTFSNAEVDDMAINDLCSQYRKRHGIPSPSELKGLRDKYGLSAHIMSKIAGIGVNQYGLYENGEMPTVVVGEKLSSLFNKVSLLSYIDKASAKLGKDYEKVRSKVENSVEMKTFSLAKQYYCDYNVVVSITNKPVAMAIKKPRWGMF